MDYLNNKTLHKELIVCQNRGEFTRDLYKMISLMIDRYTWRFTYANGDIRQDCIGYAYERCYKGYHKYDPNRGTAFTFITQIVKNAFYFEFNRQVGIKNGKKIDFVSFSRLFTGEINI